MDDLEVGYGMVHYPARNPKTTAPTGECGQMGFVLELCTDLKQITCPQCRKIVMELATTNGRVACPVCGKWVTKNGTGTLQRHKTVSWDKRMELIRSGSPPAPWCTGGGRPGKVQVVGLTENQALAKQYPILQFFQYNHLDEELRKISAPWGTLAWKMARSLPHNAETSTALRKLLEGKDAAVRAAIMIQND